MFRIILNGEKTSHFYQIASIQHQTSCIYPHVLALVLEFRAFTAQNMRVYIWTQICACVVSSRIKHGILEKEC